MDTRDGECPTIEEVEVSCWLGHGKGEPLLELGEDSRRPIGKWLRRYLIARIGFSVVLHAAESAGLEVEGEVLRASDTDPEQAASVKVARFLRWVWENSDAINGAARSMYKVSVVELASGLADSKPEYLNCKAGPADNAKEFLRYAMGQLRPKREELRAYDQSYLTYKRGRSPNSPWIVDPGPALLLLLVHVACSDSGLDHVSLSDFRRCLGDYGLQAPSGELTGGTTGRRLEELGLAIESPDAGGGRLLLDPFILIQG